VIWTSARWMSGRVRKSKERLERFFWIAAMLSRDGLVVVVVVKVVWLSDERHTWINFRLGGQRVGRGIGSR